METEIGGDIVAQITMMFTGTAERTVEIMIWLSAV